MHHAITHVLKQMELQRDNAVYHGYSNVGFVWSNAITALQELYIPEGADKVVADKTVLTEQSSAQQHITRNELHTLLRDVATSCDNLNEPRVGSAIRLAVRDASISSGQRP